MQMRQCQSILILQIEPVNTVFPDKGSDINVESNDTWINKQLMTKKSIPYRFTDKYFLISTLDDGAQQEEFVEVVL